MIRRRVVAVGAALLLAASVSAPANATPPTAKQPVARFATFNASLNRNVAGQLVDNLGAPYDGSDPFAAGATDTTLRRWQAANVAEVIQIQRPDVLVINEFDYDEAHAAVDLFRENYLEISQNGAEPIAYPYAFVAPSNTGVPTGFDLDNSGSVGGGNDAYGFGLFPGQYGMAVFSMYPIAQDQVRTFQHFLWKDMPGNLMPPGYYDAAETEIFRLSSKSHWDVPIEVGRTTVHFLVSHPTPPTFDGDEDRNGRRNHDEIRFWADYVDPDVSAYIYDDAGRAGGLPGGARFVIAGDQNADPADGDSVDQAIDQLLDADKIRDVWPSSAGGTEAALLQGGANASHDGDPEFDTADFADGAPGNLRVDYVLPSVQLKPLGAGVFWPTSDDPLARLTGTFNFAQFLRDGIGYPTSDHRMVWLDLRVH
jgi:hypothetical protein